MRVQLDHRNRKPRKGGALEALTKSALALPGLAGLAPLAAPVAHADAPTPDWEVDFSGSWYHEANLKTADHAEELGGSRERFSIQAYQLGVTAPVTSQIDIDVDLVFETMSGASPWYVLPDVDSTDGRPVAAMTGATIEDTRIDGQFTVNHYFDRARLSMSGGFSTENDYGSGNFGFSGERNYNDKNTVLGLGVSFSWDTITPTDAALHRQDPNFEADKKTITLSGFVTQLLSRSSVLQFGITYKNNQGFLSDPYKDVYRSFVPDRVNDTRPELRNQVTLLARYRHHFTGPNASWHFDLQGYVDNWAVKSLALETAWYQSLGERWQLIPSVRYYSQSQAEFYVPYISEGNPTYFTSDYRLSPFGAIQGGLRLEGVFDDWTKWAVWRVSLGYDYYWADDMIALGKVSVRNPGLVRWGLLSGQISGKF